MNKIRWQDLVWLTLLLALIFGTMLGFRPLNIPDETNPNALAKDTSDLRVFFGYIGWTLIYNTALILAMMRLFQVRWRVAD